MTALSAASDAAVQLWGRELPTLFSSTEQEVMELRTLLHDVAEDIGKAYDWPILIVKHSINGDGVDTSFPLPVDYDRMPIKSNLYSTRSQLPLARVHDIDQWLEFEITPVVGYPGYWMLLGGEVQIKPALATGENFRFYYVSNRVWTDGTPKERATQDGDRFRLPERLITMGLIWRWRQMKRLEYGEDMASYQAALEQETARAKGSRILKVGRPRISRGVVLAYPGEVVP
jgi:hypothetical protein